LKIFGHHWLSKGVTYNKISSQREKFMADELAKPMKRGGGMLGGFFGMLDNDVSHIAQTHQYQAGVEVGADDNANSGSNRQFLKQHTG
jgi:hypothetical protein